MGARCPKFILKEDALSLICTMMHLLRIDYSSLTGLDGNYKDEYPPAISTMPKKRDPEREWSLHPKLHDAVSLSLEEGDLFFDFNNNDTAANCIRDYDTNIMGRFICWNDACRTSGWSSKKIATTIRMYAGATYNARIYHQRCRSCKKLGRLVLKESSYVERVTYRLKKWNGIEMEIPHFSGQSRGPHDEDLCEGCRHGHCSAGFKE